MTLLRTLTTCILGFVLSVATIRPAAAAQSPSLSASESVDDVCEVIGGVVFPSARVLRMNLIPTVIVVRGDTAYLQHLIRRETPVIDWQTAHQGQGELSWAWRTRIRVKDGQMQMRGLLIWHDLDIDRESGALRRGGFLKVATFEGNCTKRDIALGYLTLLQLEEEPVFLKIGRALDGDNSELEGWDSGA